MPTNRPTETRHRWTREEERRLVEASRPYATLSEAADALYVGVGMPRSTVHAKLYDLHMRGQVPWLEVHRESRDEFSASFRRAVREMARVMRVEGITDAMLVVPERGPAEVQVVRRAVTIDVPLEREED